MKLTSYHSHNGVFGNTPPRNCRVRNRNFGFTAMLSAPSTVQDWNELIVPAINSMISGAGECPILLTTGFSVLHPEDMFCRKTGNKIAFEKMKPSNFFIHKISPTEEGGCKVELYTEKPSSLRQCSGFICVTVNYWPNRGVSSHISAEYLY